MALTTDEKAYIRDNSGDTESLISDATLQVIYDSSTQGNSDLDRTVYHVIRRLYARFAKLVATSTPDIPSSVSANQKFEQYEGLLKLWGAITGIGSGVNIGSSATFTYRADSLQTEEPDYSTDYTVNEDDV